MRVRQQLRSKEERGRWQSMAVTACRYAFQAINLHPETRRKNLEVTEEAADDIKGTYLSCKFDITVHSPTDDEWVAMRMQNGEGTTDSNS